jgi:hypothetical protein
MATIKNQSKPRITQEKDNGSKFSVLTEKKHGLIRKYYKLKIT